MKNISKVSCIFLFGLAFCSTGSSGADNNYILWKTLSALQGGLNFLEQEYKRLNLDAVIGTRLVEGWYI